MEKMTYRIATKGTRAAVINTKLKSVEFVLDSEGDGFLKLTVDLLYRFTEGGEKAIDSLKALGQPRKGYWYEDEEYTKDLIHKGTMLFGTDYEKYVKMAAQNPKLLQLNRVFAVQPKRTSSVKGFVFASNLP